MTSVELLNCLAQVESHLASGIHSLMILDTPAATCPAAFETAAALLEKFPAGELNADERKGACQLLQQLSTQTSIASSLLESAAQLYFGNMLFKGFVHGGYRTDGGLDEYGQGNFRIEG